MMKMTNGEGERVCGVVRLRHFMEREQHAHHLLHLMFFGVAVADDRLLDEARAIFVYL
jgi:hypothetical protein